MRNGQISSITWMQPLWNSNSRYKNCLLHPPNTFIAVMATGSNTIQQKNKQEKKQTKKQNIHVILV